jgi:hypothetical protein
MSNSWSPRVSVRSRRPVAAATCLLVLGACALVGAAPATAASDSPFTTARGDAPVVLTGAQLGRWSGPAADGVATPYPSGTNTEGQEQIPGKVAGGDQIRSAHNGTMAPAPPAIGAEPDQVSAWKWTGSAWTEVPVQVDQKFPYFLANGHSDFAFYSGTDKELTYAWAPDQHATGEEAWKKIFGKCRARYASTDPLTRSADIGTASQPNSNGIPAYSPAAGETPADYTQAMQDPVPTIDADDEIAFQAGDAGVQAPLTQAPPAGTTAGSGQTVAVTDPTTRGVGYVYLFLKPTGSRFNASNGYVKMTRDPDADDWIDRDSYASGSNDQLGSSNTGYGPNLHGTVCADPSNPATSQSHTSDDRFPRDGMTVTTDRYKLRATGRWMVRDYSVAAPGQTSEPITYGPDLIDRWKGRAFQQSPDSVISYVGFEDEQVNWEANAALLGWRQGPVRAIREIWGADSGTNVTKTETYYRNTDVYRYHVRVHPIPADGLYTSWDYNKGVAATYYNSLRPNGVAIDGINDDTGQVDKLPDSGQPCPWTGQEVDGNRVPCPGDPAYIDVADPTFDIPSAVERPEQVSGKGDAGAVAYVFELKGATSATNSAAVPYYRDDSCLDDGTGDDPVARPWPGEASFDPRVAGAYVQRAIAKGAPKELTFDELKAECEKHASAAPWGRDPFQGAFASHGTHFFATHDSDNGTAGVPVDEVDGQQWRYAIPETQPTNWIGGDPTKANYALNVIAPLQTIAFPYGTAMPESSVPEVPFALLLPFVAIAVIGGTTWARRRTAV